MDTAHLLSRQCRPQSYCISIQRIDGRCDRVRASTHRWLDEAPTPKGACLRLTFPKLVHPAAECRWPAAPWVWVIAFDHREGRKSNRGYAPGRFTARVALWRGHYRLGILLIRSLNEPKQNVSARFLTSQYRDNSSTYWGAGP